MQQLRDSKTSVIAADGYRVRQEDSARAPHMLRGAFKSFNPLETSTEVLVCRYSLGRRVFERKKKEKHDNTNTAEQRGGTLLQRRAHAKSH